MSEQLPVVESEIVPTLVAESIRDVAAALREGKMWDMDVTHSFTHDEAGKVNLYTRGCLMLPGGIYISEKHKTQHPWFMLKGDCWVYSSETGWRHFVGANSGITQTGTQRILYIVEPTVWATCHPTDSEDLAALEKRIIEPTEFSHNMVWNARPNLTSLL